MLPDFLTAGPFFFEAPATFDEKLQAKNWKPEALRYVIDISQLLGELPMFDAASIEQMVRDYAQHNSINTSLLIHPLRLALSGMSQGPSLWQMIAVLGKEEVLKRLTYACEIMG